MSESLHSKKSRMSSLMDYALGILDGKDNLSNFHKNETAIKEVTPHDVVELVDTLSAMDIPLNKLITGLKKILTPFYKSLQSYAWDKPDHEDFLFILRRENEGLVHRIEDLKPLVRRINQPLEDNEYRETLDQMAKQLKELSAITLHYSKKENILFPYLEKNIKPVGCLAIMWAIHDTIRKIFKDFQTLLQEADDQKNSDDLKKINVTIGKLFFELYAIYYREEYMLFPVAKELLNADLWDEMHRQSFEIGFAFIATPVEKENKAGVKATTVDDTVDLQTGSLSPEQIVMMMNALPVDTTFIDEHDTVRYFSESKDRIFTRSQAVIGRKVQNCHPPDSVHIVNKILESFRKGEKDKARFWLTMQDRFILIEYTALFDSSGDYRGTLEVSQDVTGIKKLKGEQRLLDW